MKTLGSLLLLACVGFSTCLAEEEIDPKKLKNTVTISPGQKLEIVFQQDGNILTGPKPVQAGAQAETPILSFRFNKENQMVLLITKNPFPKTLEFRALARIKGSKEYFETSILPIETGLSSFESWSDPIEELVLFDFKLTDQKSQ